MERPKYPISTLSFEQISKCLVVDTALVLLKTYTYELSLRIAHSIIVIPLYVLFISGACKLTLPSLLKTEILRSPNLVHSFLLYLLWEKFLSNVECVKYQMILDTKDNRHSRRLFILKQQKIYSCICLRRQCPHKADDKKKPPASKAH